MANLIQYAKEQVSELTRKAYEAAAAEDLLPAGAEVRASIEIPKDPKNGDYASSFAMAGAKAMKITPTTVGNHMARMWAARSWLPFSL